MKVPTYFLILWYNFPKSAQSPLTSLWCSHWLICKVINILQSDKYMDAIMLCFPYNPWFLQIFILIIACLLKKNNNENYKFKFHHTQTDAHVKKSKWLMQHQTEVAAAAQPLQCQQALQCQVHHPRAGDYPPNIQMCKWEQADRRVRFPTACFFQINTKKKNYFTLLACWFSLWGHEICWPHPQKVLDL